jgi:hypothetical protein
MLKELIDALPTIGGFCATLQRNPDGARHLLALAAIAAVVCVAYWALRR